MKYIQATKQIYRNPTKQSSPIFAAARFFARKAEYCLKSKNCKIYRESMLQRKYIERYLWKSLNTARPPKEVLQHSNVVIASCYHWKEAIISNTRQCAMKNLKIHEVKVTSAEESMEFVILLVALLVNCWLYTHLCLDCYWKMVVTTCQGLHR